MPLTSHTRTALAFVAPGAIAGLVACAFSRLMIEPLIGVAVDYEGAREHAEAQFAGGTAHDDGHELFTRATQANVGSMVGVVVFGVAMGVLFAVACTVISKVLERHGFRPDATGLALLVAAGMFVAIALVPGLKYPANPPAVGLEDTIGARSSAFLTMTVVSVVAAGAFSAAGLAWAHRWGCWRATGTAVAGYAVIVLTAMALLPGFGEVPGPIGGPNTLVLGGFPAEVLGEFRVYSLANLALMWSMIGATWAALTARRSPRPRVANTGPCAISAS